MRRHSDLIRFVALVAVALVGGLGPPDCRAQGDSASGGGGLPEGTFGGPPALFGGATLRIAMWTTGLPGEVELYREIVDDFQRKTPDVQLFPAIYDWREDIQPIILDGELRRQTDPADVVLLRDTWLPEVADELLSLDTAMGGTARKGYADSVLDACRVDGALRAMPFSARTKCLLYRPDVLRRLRLKPPSTWDELPAVAQKVAAQPGMWGFGLPAAPSPESADVLLVMLWAAGGAIADDEGRLVVGPELLKAAQLCTDLVNTAHATQPQPVTWTQWELEERFLAGQVGMLIAEPSLAQRAALLEAESSRRRPHGAPTPQCEYAVAPLPQGTTRATRLSVDCFGVSARTPRPELALRFVRHASQDRYAAELCRIGLLSAKKVESGSAGPRGEKGLGAFLDSLGYARPVPAELWPQVWPYLADVLVATLTGRMSPQAALEELLPPDVPAVLRLDKSAAEAEKEIPEPRPEP